jgi:hypothetical protein
MVNGDVVLLVVGSLELSQILHTIKNSIIDIPNVFVAGLNFFSGLNSIRHVRPVPCQIEFRLFRIYTGFRTDLDQSKSGLNRLD